MPLDFPNDPAVGDIFAGAGARWLWDGAEWTSLMTSGGPFLPLTGGELSGPLMLAADPAVALHAATKQYVDAGGSGYLPLTGGELSGPLMLAAMSTVIPPAGVGSLQGHAVNGTVIQGSGSATDFLVNNNAGGIVAQVPTGGRKISFNQVDIGGTAGVGIATGMTGLAVTAFPVYSTTAPALINFNFNPSGHISSGTVSYANISVADNADTTGTTGNGGNWFAVVGTPGASMVGGRNAAFTEILVNTKTRNTSAAGVGGAQYVALATLAQATVNDNGTPGNSLGNLWAFNPAVFLTGAATYWNSAIAAEFDMTVAAGTSVNYKQGMKVGLGPLDAVDGTIESFAYSVVMGANATASPGWKIGYAFGSHQGWWPINPSQGTMIGTIPTTVAGGGPTYAAAFGIDFSAVTFGTAFLKSAGFLVDGSGNVTAAAGAFTALTAPTQAIGNESTAVATTAFVASAAAGVAGVILPDADTTLTTAQVDRRMVLFSGTLTAPRTVTMPVSQGFRVWLLRNGTAGAQNITIKGPSGTGVVITANATAEVWTDGVNIYGTQTEFPITAGFRIGDLTRNQVVVVTGAAPTNVSSISCLGTGGLQFTSNVSFNSAAPIAKPTVSGAKGSNAALASLITALASYGLITDTTTA